MGSSYPKSNLGNNGTPKDMYCLIGSYLHMYLIWRCTNVVMPERYAPLISLSAET